MFFAAMVAKSLISWCVFPVLGPSSVIDTAAMVVGFGQAYLVKPSVPAYVLCGAWD